MQRAPARSGRFNQGALLLLALAVVYAIFEFALPRTLPHPIHPDDYANVSGGFADMAWRWKRPVSANLIFLVAEFGPTVAYAALSALAVLDAGLVLLFLGTMFRVRIGLLPGLMFGVIVFSHASAFQHATYLGLLTNLISHLFGLTTLFALYRGWHAGRGWWLALAACTCLLSAFAKEDFLLPPLLLIVFFASAGDKDGVGPVAGAVRRKRWLGAATLVAICVGSLLWNAYARNPFVAGLFSPATSNAAYAVDLSPLALAHAFWTLLGVYAPFASLAAVLACAWLWITAPRLRPTLLWYAVTVAALVLPYAMIPHNMPTFRAYAWLPWLAGIVVIALQASAERFAGASTVPRVRIVPAIAGIGIALLLAWAHDPARTAVVSDYARIAGINRRMVETLLAQRAAIGDAPAVGLMGLEGSSPWCANDARYINGKLGFHNRWIVFVPRESACYSQQIPDARRKLGINVAVVETQNPCAYGSLPVLEYAVDGSGRLKQAADYCDGAKR